MIGVLCGLYSEAKIADRIPNVLVGCSAARPERAEALANYLIEQGASRLISFGLAGGLSPDLEPGDLLLGATVVSAQGAWEAEPVFNKRALGILNCYTCAPIWGSEAIIAAPEAKEEIYRRTGCMATDMESQVVARAAAKARIPFNVIRAVADMSTTVFPPAAFLPLLEDGKVDFRAVFQSIKKDPRQISALIPLGMASGRALRALRHAVSVIREVETKRLARKK